MKYVMSALRADQARKEQHSRERRRELLHCYHCNRDGLRPDEMEPLWLCEYGNPRQANKSGASNCCKSCWSAFMERYPFMQRPSNIEHVGE